MELAFPLSERQCLILKGLLVRQIRYLRDVVAIFGGTLFAFPSALHGDVFTPFLLNNRSLRPSMTGEKA
jgi:hypothetical protein